MGAGIKTQGGKDKWSVTVVESILTNEKYHGAALLQKKFTYDFLTKKAKKNCGELPQYYIENDHAPSGSRFPHHVFPYGSPPGSLNVAQKSKKSRSPEDLDGKSETAENSV